MTQAEVSGQKPAGEESLAHSIAKDVIQATFDAPLEEEMVITLYRRMLASAAAAAASAAAGGDPLASTPRRPCRRHLGGAAALKLQEASTADVLLNVQADHLIMLEWSSAQQDAHSSSSSGNDNDIWVAEMEAWIEDVALPILRSGRKDLDPVRDFLGMQVASTLASLFTIQPKSLAALERVTLLILDDISAVLSDERASIHREGKGKEEESEDMLLSEFFTSRARWTASVLEGLGKSTQADVPHALVDRCLDIIFLPQQQPVGRSIFVRAVSPAFCTLLRKEASLGERMWEVILHLEKSSDDIEGQRDAHAMLCILYEVLVPLLALEREPKFWDFLLRGLASDCNAVRKRALYVVGLQVEAAASLADMNGSSSGKKRRPSPVILWWQRFVQSFDILDTARESHLLDQVYPVFILLLQESFLRPPMSAAAAEAEEGHLSSFLPTPSPPWGEVLLARGLTVASIPIQRAYLTWLISEDKQACAIVSLLSQHIVFSKVLPAANEVVNIKEERDAFILGTGRFLARFVMAQSQESGARADFLRSLLSYCKDVMKSSLVRLATLAFVEQEDILLPQAEAGGTRTLACLGVEELELARQLLVLLDSIYNQRVILRVAELILTFVERFIDCRLFVNGGEGGGGGGNAGKGAEVLRNFLLDLPQKLSLDTCHGRLIRWLHRFDAAAAEEGRAAASGWWGASTALALQEHVHTEPTPFASVLSVEGARCLDKIDRSFLSGCALACFFLAAAEEKEKTNDQGGEDGSPPPAQTVMKVLAPILHIFGRMHSHPYLDMRSCLSSLLLFQSLGHLLKKRSYPVLQQILRQHVSGEVDEYLVAILEDACCRQYGDEEEAMVLADIFALCREALGTLVWLAADLGQVAASTLRLTTAVLDVITTCATGQDGRQQRQQQQQQQQLARALAVLRTLLDNLFMQQGQALFMDVLALTRASHLKDSLINVAASIRSGGDSSSSTIVADLWRCLALLYKMHSAIKDPSLQQQTSQEDMLFFFSALETVVADSVPDVLFCMSCNLVPYLLAAAAGGQQGAEDKEEHMRACLDQVVDLALQSIKECNYGLCVTQVAIEMVFSPQLFSDPQFLVCLPVLRRFFRVLMEMGTMKRGYIVVNATARLIQVWGRRHPSPDGGGTLINISALSSFAEELVRLLVLAELSDSMYHRSDDEDMDLAEAGVLLKEDVEEEEASVAAAESECERDPEEPSFLRITVLCFLTKLFRTTGTETESSHQPQPHQEQEQEQEQQQLLQQFLCHLLVLLYDTAAAVDIRLSQIRSSPEFSQKLRAWQAFCVLAPFVGKEGLPDILTRVLDTARSVSLPAVRVYQEVVIALFCQKSPEAAIPLLVEALGDLKISPLASSSLVLAGALTCLTKDPLFLPDEQGTRALPQRFVAPLLKAVLPWLSGTYATTRIGAQLLCDYLFSRLPMPGPADDGDGDDGLDAAYLRGTLDFLRNSKEVVALRRREVKRFNAMSMADCCTVNYLIRKCTLVDGDFLATHLDEELKKAMAILYREIEAEYAMAYSTMMTPKEGSLFGTRHDAQSARIFLESAAATDTFSVQKKIVVSDVLESLLLPSPTPSSLPASSSSSSSSSFALVRAPRKTNGRGQPYQELIVCASLLDRLPNLAGLARTSEIFAVSKLVVPDAKMISDPLFDQISSSAGRWIGVEEVKEQDTLPFLQRCKRQGYTVVALEQTTDSACLSTVALPRRMVLLLGRELQGIPVPLLHEVDLKVEIPQLGLVRSLNVHVSASLIIWEYTRQHRYAKKNAQQQITA